MRNAIVVPIVLGVVLISILGSRAIWQKIRNETTFNRALPDMMALSAAVRHFEQENGRLPSSTEFDHLNPAPNFTVPFANDSLETRTVFNRQEKLARDTLDPFGRPYIYEQTDSEFVIRSHGPDAFESDDDFIYDPIVR